MNELAVVDEGADWRRLKALVLLRNSTPRLLIQAHTAGSPSTRTSW
jgi:hypothetical protein